MKNSKFVIEKLAKLFEQGLVSSKDIANEIMTILKSKRDEIVFKMKLTSKDEFEVKDPEINKMMEDLQLTLQSLNYKNKEINTILPIIIKEVDSPSKKENNLSFEILLKLAMNYLDKESSNIAS